TALPMECPACKGERTLQPCGPGVERVAEEAAKLLPGARTLVVTSDTITGPAAAAEMVRRITEHEIDLVIGTQIVAKGHDFPLLTLVGVVDADLSLGGGDLRAAERTWQLLAQVSGRAGRAERPGRVLLQTYMPEHPVLQALAAGDRERFLAAEMAARRRDVGAGAGAARTVARAPPLPFAGEGRERRGAAAADPPLARRHEAARRRAHQVRYRPLQLSLSAAHSGQSRVTPFIAAERRALAGAPRFSPACCMTDSISVESPEM